MKLANKLGAVVALSVMGAHSAMAQAAGGTGTGTGGVDLTQMTNAFTPGQITTAVLAVGVTLMTVYVAIKAAKIVLAFLRG